MRRTYWIGIIIVVIMGGYWLSTDFDVIPISFNSTLIELPNDTLYFKLKSFGDNSSYALSENNSDSFSENENYIFYVTPIFCKVNSDTIKIYCYKKSEIPVSLNTKAKIIQVELTNPEMMDLISDNKYKEMGYKLLAR